MKSNIYNAGEKFIRDQIRNCPSLDLMSQGDTIVSFSPADFLWGYTYHSHCIPPFRPSEVLILGYGKGQIADLIRKIYGSDIKVTGVDLVKQDYKYIEYKIKICDAYEFVKSCTDHILKTRYDYIVIDLFDGDVVPQFIFDVEFVVRLKEMTKRLICINIPQNEFDKLKNYKDYGFEFHRLVPIFRNYVVFFGV